MRLLAHARGVDQPHLALLAIFRIGPQPVDRDRIAGDARFGPGQQPVLAQQAVDERRFARVGAADDGELERAEWRILAFIQHFGGFLGGFGLGADDRPQRVEEIGHALAMLGAERDRLAETERVALEDAAVARGSFGLVGYHHDRDVLPA